MTWTIDTGSAGAYGVAPSSLKSFLEEALAHHKKTSLEKAVHDVVQAAGKTPDDAAAVIEFHTKLNERMSASKAKVQEYLTACEPWFARGIKAACDLAEGFDGNVCATISGHTDPNHPSAVEHRISVDVDSAPYK